MKIIGVRFLASLFCAWPLSGALAENTNQPVQLYVPDGQLRSHLIRVYINQDIKENMEPHLVLHVPHALLHAHARETNGHAFYRLSRDYRWTQKVDGESIQQTGTLLLFDLNSFPIPWFKAMTRITPTLVWKEGEQTASVIGDSEIYLANPIGAALWSVLTIAAIGLFIARMSWNTAADHKRSTLERLFGALANPDGSLSMWRAQLAAWTLAIGGVVFGYGLIRLEVPEIPETLVALMGLSLATGGLSALKQPASPDSDTGGHKHAGGKPKTSTRLPMRLSDLITNWNSEAQCREVSVAKSQMVFWTILTLGIFLTKSLTDGTLWPVPWQLVALMGMSQAGYVVPKFNNSLSGDSKTPGKQTD